jgi:hypothetical protein
MPKWNTTASLDSVEIAKGLGVTLLRGYNQATTWTQL